MARRTVMIGPHRDDQLKCERGQTSVDVGGPCFSYFAVEITAKEPIIIKFNDESEVSGEICDVKAMSSFTVHHNSEYDTDRIQLEWRLKKWWNFWAGGVFPSAHVFKFLFKD